MHVGAWWAHHGAGHSIFNVTKARDVGSLAEHSTQPCALQFFRDRYLLSGNYDGTITLYDVRRWVRVHTMGHHE